MSLYVWFDLDGAGWAFCSPGHRDDFRQFTMLPIADERRPAEGFEPPFGVAADWCWWCAALLVEDRWYETVG